MLYPVAFDFRSYDVALHTRLVLLGIVVVVGLHVEDYSIFSFVLLETDLALLRLVAGIL